MPASPELPSFRPKRNSRRSALACGLCLAAGISAAWAQTPKPVPPPEKPATPAPAEPHAAKAPEATRIPETRTAPKSEPHGSPASEAKSTSREEHPATTEEEKIGEPEKTDGDTAIPAPPDHAVHRAAGGEATIDGHTGYSASTTTSGGPSTRSAGSQGIRSSLADRSQLRSSPEAEARLQSINAARKRLSGVNHVPIPEGRVIASPNGRVNVMASGGRTYSLRANGTLASYHARGVSASFRPDGKLASYTSKDLSIRRGAHGARVITAHRPDHTTLVSTGRHSGYLETPQEWASVPADASRHGMTQRTYLRGSQTWSRSYLNYSFRGRTLERYLPAVTYPASYYTWAWRAWPNPIVYKWTWINGRWYFYYRTYFAVWPSYASASYWLTDYYLGETLNDGYDMQQADDDSGDGSADAPDNPAQQPDPEPGDDEVSAPVSTAISPAMKLAIAGQVQQQLALDSMTAPASAGTEAAQPESDEAPGFLQPGYVFVADIPRNVAVSSGTSDSTTAVVAVNQPHCGLSPGDMLRLVRVPPESDPLPARTVALSSESEIAMVALRRMDELEVMASHRGDCPAGIQVRMTIHDLQEMENNFEARLDDGLEVLHGKQGKEGIPPAPADAAPATVSEPAPARSPSAAELSAQLEALESQANQAESQLTQTVLTAQEPQ